MAALNVYDYQSQPHLPFREGDLRRLLTRTLGPAAMFALMALGLTLWLRRD